MLGMAERLTSSSVLWLAGGAVVLAFAAAIAGIGWGIRRGERLANERDRRWIRVFENSPDLVICFDPEENRIVSVNPAVFRATGFTPEEVDPCTFRELYGSEAEMAAVREQYRQSALDDRPRQLEASIVDRQGRPLQLSVTCFPMDVNGKRYIYAVARDITAQKQAESDLLRAKEDAESANRIKGEFLAILTHEIRTPLNGMIGINQIMLETELTDKQREMLLVQEKSGQALLRVVNDVLDFSKIESGSVTLADEPFPLTACLEECLDAFSVAAGSKGLELSGKLSPELPPLVYGDHVRLGQVLFNLVGNAVKFTESGSVLLEARVVEGESPASPAERIAWIEFLVSDTGIGIDPSKVHLLFLPFSQLTNERGRRSYEGTGLGLAICRDLVERMGGSIWVEAGRKKGAAFGFRIPFRLAEADAFVS